MKKLPENKEGWLEEVARAYRDAYETLQFNSDIKSDDLFHLGPSVCLKFRRIRATKSKLKRATDAALASYVATQDQDEGVLRVPQMTFAFCYLASHFGLDLLDEDKTSEILGYLEENLERLVTMTE